jgi:hypothetical protein
MGALPLNAAEIFLILGVGSLLLSFYAGDTFRSLRTVRRFTMDLTQVKKEEVAEVAARTWKTEKRRIRTEMKPAQGKPWVGVHYVPKHDRPLTHGHKVDF